MRRTAWRTVLSGADAGLGYGTLEIWPWNDNYREGQKMQGLLNPYDWRECLKFRGAKDVGLLKEIIMTYAQNGLTPITLNSSEINVAESEEYLLVYNPVANPVNLSELKIKNKKCKVIDLNNLRVLHSTINNGVVPMMPVLEDELIIIHK